MSTKGPPVAPPLPDREALERGIVARHPVRFQLALILLASFATALIVTRALLALGVGSMMFRYPLALIAAWGAFVVGVRLWLAYAGYGEIRAPSWGKSNVDATPDVGWNWPRYGGAGSAGGGRFGSGGGRFGGGGASGDFDAGMPARGFLSGSGGSTGGGHGGGGGSGWGIDLGDDGWVLLALITLLAAVFGAAGYLIYAAPDILADAAFALLLGGGLARARQTRLSGGWLRSVVHGTLWPFLIVLGLALLFAVVAQQSFPEARTMRDVIRRL
jgi:hypothetical protein